MTRTTRTRRTILGAAGVAAAALVAGVLSACAPTLGNPAVRQTPNAPHVFDNSDPSVLVTNGTTYLFGSSNNKRLPVRQITSYTTPVTESQTAWARNPIDAMPQVPAWVDTREAEIWAPSVVQLGSTYWVFFAAHHKGATTDEANDQCIGRASSASPTGPYRPEASPIYCGLPREGAGNGLPASNSFGRGALDPEFVRGPKGKNYLLVALSRTGDNIGSVELNSASVPVGGLNAKPTILASQSLPFHDGTDDSTRGSSFLENPTMAYDAVGQTYLLFYSAGHWATANYVTGFARCASPAGPCTLDTRGPFQRSGNGRTGPGGMTVFRSPGGQLMVAYASWAQGHESPSAAANADGRYSRRTHWAKLLISGSDPKTQTVKLG